MVVESVVSNVANRVLEYASGLPEGSPITSAGLGHIASRSRVNKALSQLTRERRFMRASRGVYVRSVESRFGIGAPSASKVAMGVAAMKGKSVATHGATAANALGLTTQVPMREIFVTTGPSRKLHLGKQIVELRHVPEWQMTLAGRPGGEVLRALAWLGPERASAAVPALRSKLPPLEAQAIAREASRLPPWLARQVSSLAA